MLHQEVRRPVCQEATKCGLVDYLPPLEEEDKKLLQPLWGHRTVTLLGTSTILQPKKMKREKG